MQPDALGDEPVHRRASLRLGVEVDAVVEGEQAETVGDGAQLREEIERRPDAAAVAVSTLPTNSPAMRSRSISAGVRSSITGRRPRRA